MEFNPDTAIDLYNVKKNQVKMIYDRGFNTYNFTLEDNDAKYLQMSTDDFVMDAWNNIAISTNPKDYFNALYYNEQTTKTIRVVYLEVEVGKDEVSVNSIRKYMLKDVGYSNIISIPFGTGYVNRILFVSPKKLNIHAKREIEENIINNGIEAEVFTWIELLSVSPEHLYNGHTKIIPKEQEREMIKNLFVNPDSKKDEFYNGFAASLPIILHTDILARYYGAKSQDILLTKADVFTHNSLLRDNITLRRVK
jgi:hypothetical protein